MTLFNKYDSFLLFGTNLKKNDIIVIGPAYPNPATEPSNEYIVIKEYKFNLYRRILEWIGIPFKHHNCVHVKQYKDARIKSKWYKHRIFKRPARFLC